MLDRFYDRFMHASRNRRNRPTGPVDPQSRGSVMPGISLFHCSGCYCHGTHGEGGGDTAMSIHIVAVRVNIFYRQHMHMVRNGTWLTPVTLVYLVLKNNICMAFLSWLLGLKWIWSPTTARKIPSHAGSWNPSLWGWWCPSCDDLRWPNWRYLFGWVLSWSHWNHQLVIVGLQLSRGAQVMSFLGAWYQEFVEDVSREKNEPVSFQIQAGESLNPIYLTRKNIDSTIPHRWCWSVWCPQSAFHRPWGIIYSLQSLYDMFG